ncbi:chemotaxis protein [Vibrio navarrensis]|uniref:DUF3379 domain-containing protein n=1 Tax=Vibrio navarrensis TaxID=29495 RepID=A0AAJ4I9M9_9VIBR|nr:MULTISPECIES: DUF3379 family protein [Vibrio]KJR29496.1 chemotaxis protein [Vibrio sp. S234-5]MBE3661588.1 chemotaxis protein [Vibrio navarrensis]MBE4591843.1 chemotaxis protein [Vibrio navarrensis]MBE4604779.1 chemotaxis protein [Vibrio navarrensis]QPL52766.1 DUF3379 domain-containing protein [Vibrio navarrensis]
MDDLEFRRRILSDPKQLDEEMLQTLAGNESHNKFLDDVLDLDSQIKQAMNVSVPDDLVDKILFSQSSIAGRENIARPAFGKKAMAMAASFAFTAGLLFGQLNWGNLLVSPAQASLAETAVQHVIAESAFVNQLDEQVSSEQINAKLSPFEYQFDQRFPYHVYYLNHCGFGQSNALHMVFQGKQGKVTLFLTNIPPETTGDFSQSGLSAIVKAVGNSSLILVGEQGEDVAQLANKLAPMIKPMP